MTKYQYTPEMDEISGFGGGYEETCRKMVVAGVEWADAKGDADPQYKEFENIYGITTGENADAKAMQDAMLKAADKRLHSAQLCEACKHSWNEYLVEDLLKQIKELEEKIESLYNNGLEVGRTKGPVGNKEEA